MRGAMLGKYYLKAESFALHPFYYIEKHVPETTSIYGSGGINHKILVVLLFPIARFFLLPGEVVALMVKCKSQLSKLILFWVEFIAFLVFRHLIDFSKALRGQAGIFTTRTFLRKLLTLLPLF